MTRDELITELEKNGFSPNHNFPDKAILIYVPETKFLEYFWYYPNGDLVIAQRNGNDTVLFKHRTPEQVLATARNLTEN